MNKHSKKFCHCKNCRPKKELSEWVMHVLKYTKNHDVSYKDALKLASPSYVKKSIKQQAEFNVRVGYAAARERSKFEAARLRIEKLEEELAQKLKAKKETDFSLSHEDVLNFGRHRSKSFKDIYETKKQYCNWVMNLEDPSPEMEDFQIYCKTRKQHEKSRVPLRPPLDNTKQYKLLET